MGHESRSHLCSGCISQSHFILLLLLVIVIVAIVIIVVRVIRLAVLLSERGYL